MFWLWSVSPRKILLVAGTDHCLVSPLPAISGIISLRCHSRLLQSATIYSLPHNLAQTWTILRGDGHRYNVLSTSGDPQKDILSCMVARQCLISWVSFICSLSLNFLTSFHIFLSLMFLSMLCFWYFWGQNINFSLQNTIDVARGPPILKLSETISFSPKLRLTQESRLWYKTVEQCIADYSPDTTQPIMQIAGAAQCWPD